MVDALRRTAATAILGFLESISIGILRGPDLVMKVVNRVNELLSSENLDTPKTSEEDEGGNAL